MSFINHPGSRPYARLTGALYVAIAIAGGFSILYVPSQLTVPGDALATAQAIASNRALFNLGILGDVAMILAEMAVTALLYFMFRHVSGPLSLIATFARLSMATTMAAMLLFHAAALAFIEPSTAFSPEQQAELARVMRHAHDAGVWVWQLSFWLHLVILGQLVARSGTYPRLLGHGMTLGAFGYLADSLAAFAFPDLAPLATLRDALLVVVTLSEVGFALWLLIVGPRQTTEVGLSEAAA